MTFPYESSRHQYQFPVYETQKQLTHQSNMTALVVTRDWLSAGRPQFDSQKLKILSSSSPGPHRLWGQHLPPTLHGARSLLKSRRQSLSLSRHSRSFTKSKPLEYSPHSHTISLQDILIHVILPSTSWSPKCVFSQ
jgi:hypothetical protein